MEFYVVFSAPVTISTAQNLMAACSQLVTQKGATSLRLLISTPGGEVPAGMTLYNFFKALPIPVITHNIGNVDSIGNAMFLAGKQRLACPHSTFMFHGVGRNAEKIMLEEKNLKETLAAILADQKRIGDIIVSETNITAENAGKLFAEASTKDADFALANGIVHSIEQLQIPLGAPIISLVLT
ncbi:MAG: hypothetical protein QOF41_60 [Methylobacteriaceae bacterium]|nr:hypothetical protein [Methylobacteriaceae bacterium]